MVRRRRERKRGEGVQEGQTEEATEKGEWDCCSRAHYTIQPLTYCAQFELLSQRSAAVSIWLKGICWVTLFGMRLQQTVNSPTQSRIIQHKQAEMIKLKLISLCLKQQLIIPSPSLHLMLLFLLCLFCLISPFFLSFFPSPRQLFSPSIRPSFSSLPPQLTTVVALVTIQRNFLRSSVTVATLGFPPGRCWTCAALRPTPASVYWPPSNWGHPWAGSRSTADAAISESGGDADTPRWRVWGCWRCRALIVSRQALGLFQAVMVWAVVNIKEPGLELIFYEFLSFWFCFTSGFG